MRSNAVVEAIKGVEAGIEPVELMGVEFLHAITSTPAWEFRRFFWQDEKLQCVFNAVCRSGFRQEVLLALYLATRSHSLRGRKGFAIRSLASASPFSSFAASGTDYARTYPTLRDTLAGRYFWIFPCSPGEYWGDESVAEYNGTNKISSPVAWDRKHRPKLMARFEVHPWKMHSTPRGKLAPFAWDEVWDTAKLLPRDGASFVHANNCLGASLLVKGGIGGPRAQSGREVTEESMFRFAAGTCGESDP